MLIIRGPIKPYTFWIKIILAIFLAKTRPDHLLSPDQPDHWFWLWIIKNINAESAVFTLSCLVEILKLKFGRTFKAEVLSHVESQVWVKLIKKLLLLWKHLTQIILWVKNNCVVQGSFCQPDDSKHDCLADPALQFCWCDPPHPKPPKEPKPPQLSPQVFSAQPNVCLFEQVAVLRSRAV